MQMFEPRFDNTVVATPFGQNDMMRIAEICLMFQTCRTIAEVCDVAGTVFENEFPGLSGSISLFSETREFLEPLLDWGEAEGKECHIRPGDCWAIRRGRPHGVGAHISAPSVSCQHYHDSSADWHMCLPLIALGEVLGVLHICGTDCRTQEGQAGGAALKDAPRILGNIAESIALAIASIRRQDSLQHQAIRDPLTQLFNRRYLDDTLTREIHRASRSGEPLTFAILDVDHFKTFNDTHGHDAGDSLLKAVGSELAEQIRGSDIACRFGGEEFVLVYPGMNTDVAATRLETIRQRIERLDVTHQGQECARVTISAGIAVYPDHAADAETLVKTADTALYASKDAGRNRVTTAQGLKPVGDAARLRLVHGGDGEAGPSSGPTAAGAPNNVMDFARYR